ncbi:hypothetical protein FA13DRAFT_1817513 [Coprinellus micaceus]|uniref:Uncharacterized protein n=1 Tax=Coprinellus micaceus TaxID=71717 RepID=A0A4Y7SU61_COPMI|nr:hypothetical protein FA13DRAFT_1817513 [Coprinellus micaceus]
MTSQIIALSFSHPIPPLEHSHSLLTNSQPCSRYIVKDSPTPNSAYGRSKGTVDHTKAAFDGQREPQNDTGQGSRQGSLRREGPTLTTSAYALWKKRSPPTGPATTNHLLGTTCNTLRPPSRFAKSQYPHVKREGSSSLGPPDCEGGYRICRVLPTRTEGPSFEIPESLISVAAASPSLGFSNILTHLSVKLELDIGAEEENVEEMSYAKLWIPLISREPQFLGIALSTNAARAKRERPPVCHLLPSTHPPSRSRPSDPARVSPWRNPLTAGDEDRPIQPESSLPPPSTAGPTSIGLNEDIPTVMLIQCSRQSPRLLPSSHLDSSQYLWRKPKHGKTKGRLPAAQPLDQLEAAEMAIGDPLVFSSHSEEILAHRRSTESR